METQTLLVLIIALLTLNLLFVGIYIVLVLKEVRESVRKFNSILELFNQMVAAIATPVVGASGAIAALTQGLQAFNTVKDLKKKFSKEEEVENE